MKIPRSEYPRPQLRRDEWLCLNGEWEFETDNGQSGTDRGLYDGRPLAGRITVPFCPESALSGVGQRDFMPCVWYRREVELHKTEGKRIILHFEAADYRCEVWINGQSAGTHFGGYTGFEFDITALVTDGRNIITVRCIDDTRSGRQPVGKQSVRYDSRGCSYTRTTGIWQTVWLETVPLAHIASLRLTPDLASQSLIIEADCRAAHGLTLTAEAFFGGTSVGRGEIEVCGDRAYLRLPLSELHLWSVGDGQLYDLSLALGADQVQSYFGMRSIAYADGRMLINDRPVFQRLILDQGFYPDGIYTAPSDSELEGDIRRSMAMGFNGARLHQKIFEQRFLYHCDRLGYIVWGESASWGLDISRPEAYKGFIPEWLEALGRDFSHPSIVGWCPFNETREGQDRDLLRTVYRLTKAVDPTRPVIDTSGYIHVETDVTDAHDYTQDAADLIKRYGEGEERGEADPAITFVSEYGGIWWAPEHVGSNWGYGERPRTEEEFVERYRALTSALLGSPRLSAFCYTQLTDVEQEVNGLYTYDRRAKFDPAVISAITSAPAAIEK